MGCDTHGAFNESRLALLDYCSRLSFFCAQMQALRARREEEDDWPHVLETPLYWIVKKFELYNINVFAIMHAINPLSYWGGEQDPISQFPTSQNRKWKLTVSELKSRFF